MAHLLYRLGRFSYLRRRGVLAAWIGILILLAALAAGFGGTADAALTIPGVESVEAGELLAQRFPSGEASGATARIVFAAPDGRSLTDPDLMAAVQHVVADVGGAPQVLAVVDPYESGSVAPDGSVAFAAVQYGVNAQELETEAREALLSSGDSIADSGVRVEYGGDAVQEIALGGSSEALGVGVALVVLAITFGSVLAAGMPLLTALIGVGVGLTGVTALSALVDLTSTAPTLALMMGLAVGIDYALFIVSRYRQQMADGMPPEESAARAVATAGGAVVFAGATVVIALSGLAVVGIPFLTVMGLAAAGTVAVAVLIAITLVPALLGFAGGRLDRFKVPGRTVYAGVRADRPNFGTRWASAIVARPLPVLLAATLVLGIMAVPLLSLRLGLPSEGTQAENSTARQAYDLLAEGFGPGFNGPLIAVVDAQGASDPEAAAAAAAVAFQGLGNVVAVTPASFNPAGDTATMTVIPGSGPSDVLTEDLVNDIREQAGRLQADTGARILVTGNTAIGLDISAKLAGALPVFLLVVVGLSLILLTVVFRSLLVPLKATLGFLLTLAATFGALVAVFQWGWLAGLIGVTSIGPIVSFLPILLIGLLFGLAMDYELFLVTRMRESYVHGESADAAIVHGFTHGARVVTAAALIMMSVFAGFILGPDATIKSIGFALAFGVLIDAFVVRMTIVPAVMALLGDRSWTLPAWLDKILPNVDVEGEKLILQPTAEETPSPQPISV